MDPKTLRELLEAVQKGRVSPEQAADQLRTLPYEDLGFAKVDHHRALRRGFPEAVFGEGKTPEQVAAIVDRIYDVGVAGLHRLLDRTETIRQARVVIVAAGMEGALPSVVAGLVAAPVIAVPTSVGYGASFHGLAALLAMLNSCASGVATVNIDNGFGAAHLACQILKGAVPPTSA